MQEGDYYSPQEAARILSRSDKPITEWRIRQMLAAGALEGCRDEQPELDEARRSWWRRMFGG
jgi:hypothetical protein